MAMHHTSVVSLRPRDLCKCAFDAITDEEEALECDLQPRLAAVEFLPASENPEKPQTHTHTHGTCKEDMCYLDASLSTPTSPTIWKKHAIRLCKMINESKLCP